MDAMMNTRMYCHRYIEAPVYSRIYTLTYEQRLCLLIHYYHYRYHYQHNHQRQHVCIHIYLSTVMHNHDNNNSSSNKKIKLPHYSTYSQHISIT